MIRRLLVAVAAVVGMIASAVPATAARYYVDGALGNVADRKAMPTSEPVQLLVEFQINGVRNERGTKEATKLALAEIAKLPYFPAASVKPVSSGALLTVKINNLFSEAERKAAIKSAFKSGFTFGASDTIVRDKYHVTLRYVAATGAPALESEVDHSLVTTIGKGSDTSYGTEYKKPNDAVGAVIGQTLDHGLDTIARKAVP